MGDMAEARYDKEDFDNDETDNKTVMRRLTVNLRKNSVQSKEFLEALQSFNAEETNQLRLIRKTLKRKTKLPEILRKALDNNQELEYYHRWLETRSSNLEKLHFIIGHGILRPELRDEIYCQICKQLTENPYQTSFAKGWILLSLCLGCFAPTQRFEKYLRNFINCGPELYAPYCTERLNRTINNGLRNQPPSWLELQANRNKDRIVLEVNLMNGSVKKVQVDSASTAKEMIEEIAKNLQLMDCIGFSIVLRIFDKRMSIGCGGEHIMDAISNCEQYAKEQGKNERKAPWKIYFRKEFFVPWFDPGTDERATDLIYYQIVKGIACGEYQCVNEKDVGMICALQYYIEKGTEMNVKILQKNIPKYLPKDLLNNYDDQTIVKWEKIIMEAFNRNSYVKNSLPKKNAMEDIVIFGQLNWPMLFSRFFDVSRIADAELLTEAMVIAINSMGIFFIDEHEEVLNEFTFAELLNISLNDMEIDEITITTIQKEEFTFKCSYAKELQHLLLYIVDNLKSRSIYAVAIKNVKHETDEYLSLQRGDLIRFDSGICGAMILNSKNDWFSGECMNRKGLFSTESVYVLATILPPHETVLKTFTVEFTKSPNRSIFNTMQRKRLHTLRQFANEHFRLASKPDRGMHGMQSIRTQDELWRHTRNPIKAPLLRKLQIEKKSFDNAIIAFSYMLKYAGDMPRYKPVVSTDLIFGPAMKDEILRDEIYCQLMKQLTENKMSDSEERYWDLLWLATGCFYPSSIIMKELTEFLRTRISHSVAVDCLNRIRKTIQVGPRLYPPIFIEVEAIQNRSADIMHKICFPDDSIREYKTESCTRGFDIVNEIGRQLELESTEGFSLFVKIGEKVFSMPDDKFLFDFISEIIEWMKEAMPLRTSKSLAEPEIHYKYVLYFMKKLWLNTTLNRDINAELIFYYPQEIQKYLHGFYKIDEENALKISSIIYQIKFNNNLVPLNRIGEILSKILPKDLISLHKPDEWKKLFMNSINMHKIFDEINGKKKFLQEISKCDTFGSTFFVVQQTNDPNLPETILIAINRHGFNIIHPRNKHIMMTYEFSELNFWSSGNTFFHIRFGNMIGASKLLCTTTEGYKMDDLLTSYIRNMNEL